MDAARCREHGCQRRDVARDRRGRTRQPGPSGDHVRERRDRLDHLDAITAPRRHGRPRADHREVVTDHVADRERRDRRGAQRGELAALDRGALRSRARLISAIGAPLAIDRRDLGANRVERHAGRSAARPAPTRRPRPARARRRRARRAATSSIAASPAARLRSSGTGCAATSTRQPAGQRPAVVGVRDHEPARDRPGAARHRERGLADREADRRAASRSRRDRIAHAQRPDRTRRSRRETAASHDARAITTSSRAPR